MEKIFKRIENIFLIICLLVGFLFIIINPPFQVPDEDSHLYKMYSIVDGQFRPQLFTTPSGKSYACHILPENLTYMSSGLHYELFKKHGIMTSELYEKVKNTPLDKEKSSPFVYAIPSYGMLSYLPEIPFLSVMKFLNVPPLKMMYVLRIVSLLTYAAIMYFAIKITPVKKWMLAFCALVPVSVYLAGGINTDGLVISLSYLYIAYVFRLAYDDKIKVLRKRDYWITSLLLLYITICKFPYALLVLLLGIIPKEKFSPNFAKNKTMVSVACTLVLYTAFHVIKTMFFGVGGSPVNPDLMPLSAAIQHAVNHPLALFQNFITSVKYYSGFCFIGSIALFGWNDTFIPFYAVVIFAVMLSISGYFGDRDEIKCEIKIKDKFIFLAITVLFSLAMYAICYLCFSYEGFKNITYMQGRYYVPLLPLIYILFASKRVISYDRIKLSTMIIYTLLILICVIAIITRFYIGE